MSKTESALGTQETLKYAVGVRVVRNLPQIDILLQVASGSACLCVEKA